MEFKTGVCANCGADLGLHHFGSYQCPKNGREPYDINTRQEWQDTFFEDSGEKQLNEAAPDLLEALQNLMDEYKHQVIKHNPDVKNGAEWETVEWIGAEKAIAKALGESDQ